MTAPHPSTPAPASGLRACPFCGSENVAQGASRGFISVWCRCGARGPDVAFPDDCIEPHVPIHKCHQVWNKRALASHPAPEDKPEPDVVAGRCAKPGCGAQCRIGKPCTDWDCPQATLTAQEHRAALQAERRKREEAEAERDRHWEVIEKDCYVGSSWEASNSEAIRSHEATIASLTATIAELRAALERAEHKAGILDGLLEADNLWTDYGSGWRIHFSFLPNTSNQFLAHLNGLHSDRARARSETEAR